ncbi:rcc01693 family protein [Brucella sp. 10RB9213]|uniref:rcc01693 family protein n=1 Tax=Brucella sp. 10RB9213 TaxID=1844039 RepID=UPI001FFF5CCA|nr:rcc01693 family protein [Brucella sp. 10RB9213]
MSAAVEPKPSPVRPFPWDEAMYAGFGLLRLTPQAFWSMTPRELSAAINPLAPVLDAPSRQTLDALMLAFPDR